MAPLVRTGGSRHTGLAALPHHNIQEKNICRKKVILIIKEECLLICGDCLEEMKRIEDKSVDCIITDLPYG